MVRTFTESAACTRTEQTAVPTRQDRSRGDHNESFWKACDVVRCAGIVLGRGILWRRWKLHTATANYIYADSQLDESRKRRLDLLYSGQQHRGANRLDKFYSNRQLRNTDRAYCVLVGERKYLFILDGMHYIEHNDLQRDTERQHYRHGELQGGRQFRHSRAQSCVGNDWRHTAAFRHGERLCGYE
jgi:hypothetical protein